MLIDVFFEFREIYGCRRLARELNKRNHACSVGLVAKIMRIEGLEAVQPRAFRVTTIHGEGDVYPADFIERDFTSSEPGTRLVGDITYLKTAEGWLYLATVIDLATRMVVGWQMADHMRASLVIEALTMARLHGHVKRKAIFHSDRLNLHNMRARTLRSIARKSVSSGAWDVPVFAGITRQRNLFSLP
jgi:transposase InsO family protein